MVQTISLLAGDKVWIAIPISFTAKNGVISTVNDFVPYSDIDNVLVDGESYVGTEAADKNTCYVMVHPKTPNQIINLTLAVNFKDGNHKLFPLVIDVGAWTKGAYSPAIVVRVNPQREQAAAKVGIAHAMVYQSFVGFGKATSYSRALLASSLIEERTASLAKGSGKASKASARINSLVSSRAKSAAKAIKASTLLNLLGYGKARAGGKAVLANAVTNSIPESPINASNQSKSQAVYGFTQLADGYTGTLFTARRLSDNATLAVTADPMTKDINKATIDAWRAGADVDIDLTAGIPNQLVGLVAGTTTALLRPSATGIPFIRSNVYYSAATLFDELTAILSRDTANGGVGVRLSNGDAGHLVLSSSGLTTQNGLEFHFMYSPNRTKAGTASRGQLTGISVTGGGSGYTSSLTRPILAYLQGGGITDTVATVTPTIALGAITGFSIVNGGSGYTSAPLVWLSDTTGTGCYATATISGGVVTAVTIIGGNAGSNYSANTKVVLIGGNRTGLAQLSQTGGVITGGRVVNVGNGFTSAPTATIATASMGTGATFNPTVNVNGDCYGSDSRGEILMSYAAPASATTNNAVLKLAGSGNTYQARRIATADGGTDQFAGSESYQAEANSLQIITFNVRDTADTNSLKIHGFGRRASVIPYTTATATATNNTLFNNGTLRIGAGVSGATGTWATAGTGNTNPDFCFFGLIVTQSLTEAERLALHGRMRLKAEPHLNLSVADFDALASEIVDFRDVDTGRLVMGKKGKLALQFNTNSFNGKAPNITYGATSTYGGLTGVKLNDDLNEANTFKSVTTGTANESYWTNLDEGSVMVIGMMDATGNSPQYGSNLSDWFSIGTNNPPDQLPPAQPTNMSIIVGKHHAQAYFGTKISDSLDPNGLTGTTPWGDQSLSQAWIKYYFPTANGSCVEYAVTTIANTVNGTLYPAGTLLGWDLASATINKAPQTPEALAFGGTGINTPLKNDYLEAYVATFKNGAGYNKAGSQASRDANARTATVKSYVAPLTGCAIGSFYNSFARQLGTANNVHASSGSRLLKSQYLANSKAFYGLIILAERAWTTTEVIKLQANAFKKVA